MDFKGQLTCFPDLMESYKLQLSPYFSIDLSIITGHKGMAELIQQVSFNQ